MVCMVDNVLVIKAHRQTVAIQLHHAKYGLDNVVQKI